MHSGTSVQREVMNSARPPVSHGTCRGCLSRRFGLGCSAELSRSSPISQTWPSGDRDRPKIVFVLSADCLRMNHRQAISRTTHAAIGLAARTLDPKVVERRIVVGSARRIHVDRDHVAEAAGQRFHALIVGSGRELGRRPSRSVSPGRPMMRLYKSVRVPLWRDALRCRCVLGIGATRVKFFISESSD